MLTLEIRNAVPTDTIVLELGVPEGTIEDRISFAPGPFLGRTFSDRSDDAPGIEFLSVDPGRVTIALQPARRRHNPGPVDFELQLALEGSPELPSFTLRAEAFKGTEIEASLPGMPTRRIALGPEATTLPYTLRDSELVRA